MAVAEHPLVGLGYTHPSATRSFLRIDDNGVRETSSALAEEVPIALGYNGRPHVVVMGTPTDLEDLAVGFTRTEGIVDESSLIERIDVVRASHGVELQVQIPGANAVRLEERTRGIVSRTGCGLCGVETINDMLHVPARVGALLRASADTLSGVGDELSRRQTINNETSTVHAAGWATAEGELVVVREDVGRHNALDKVLGALGRTGVDASAGFIVVTSRASYEMVQKAATCGVELLAAISRPTGLAIRFAEAADMTLVGLLRGKTANIYCRPERVLVTG
ncbi:MAG TPA: formate dehydrogenase accessory sulfurtransferase FdhD [Casimicrobiaceae bacterium]|nr:formate dehydrogenase accessory sulfurtransferase FdhD [Casimicrobiaceae bacterium]